MASQQHGSKRRHRENVRDGPGLRSDERPDRQHRDDEAKIISRALSQILRYQVASSDFSPLSVVMQQSRKLSRYSEEAIRRVATQSSGSRGPRFELRQDGAGRTCVRARHENGHKRQRSLSGHGAERPKKQRRLNQSQAAVRSDGKCHAAESSDKSDELDWLKVPHSWDGGRLLIRFLEASAKWLTEKEDTPSAEDFRRFLESDFSQISPTLLKFPFGQDARGRCIAHVVRLADALAEAIADEGPATEATPFETDVGEFRNLTVSGFATSGFRHHGSGDYKPDWAYIKEWFQRGRGS